MNSRGHMASVVNHNRREGKDNLISENPLSSIEALGLGSRLEGRVALVTGASRGIGRAIALAFAREGAKVIVNYNRERGRAEEVVRLIRDVGGEAICIQADVGDRGMVEKIVEEALREFKGLDILVNNAGVLMGGGTLLEFRDEEFDPMWRVNVKAS